METKTALPRLPFSLAEFTESPNRAQVVAVEAPEAAVHPPVIRAMAMQAARGEHVGVILGDNRFDLYALARLARDHGFDPNSLLTRIELSRAFTCHQLHRRTCTLVPALTQKWRSLYVLGLLDTFCDESVKYTEVARLLSETMRQLKHIATSGLPVLITLSPPLQPARAGLVKIVQQAADVYYEMSAREPTPPPAPQLPLPRISLPEGHGG